MNPAKKRCGVCSACIDRELTILSMMEEAIWEDAEGNITTYFNRMGVWVDHLNEVGLP